MTELKKITVFVVVLFASILLLDKCIGAFLDSRFEKITSGHNGGNINFYLQHSQSYKLLLMGDSRCLNQVNPDSFSISTFNLAHAGMDDVFQEALLQLLLDKKKYSRNILMYIDQNTFTNPDATKTSVAYLKQFYSQSNTLKSELDRSSGYEKIKYYFSSYRYNNVVIPTIIKSLNPQKPENSGFVPIKATDYDSIRTMIGISNSPKLTREYVFSKDKHRRLERMITLCKKNNINLICFTAPIYFNAINKINFENNSIIESICNSHQIQFLNYTNIHERLPILKRSNFWTDAQHLNENGAAIFSKIISHDFDSLIAKPISSSNKPKK